MSDQKQGDVDRYLKSDGVETEREKEIGQHIGYRYDVNLVPDYARLTQFLKGYMDSMVSSSITEATSATSARAGVASRHRAMVRARMDTACHGWGKRKAPLRRTRQRVADRFGGAA